MRDSTVIVLYCNIALHIRQLYVVLKSRFFWEEKDRFKMEKIHSEAADEGWTSNYG